MTFAVGEQSQWSVGSNCRAAPIAIPRWGVACGFRFPSTRTATRRGAPLGSLADMASVPCSQTVLPEPRTVEGIRVNVHKNGAGEQIGEPSGEVVPAWGGGCGAARGRTVARGVAGVVVQQPRTPRERSARGRAGAAGWVPLSSERLSRRCWSRCPATAAPRERGRGARMVLLGPNGCSGLLESLTSNRNAPISGARGAPGAARCADRRERWSRSPPSPSAG